MVFSQTSHKTQSILKVVEIDRLKSGKNQQVNCPSGVITDESADTTTLSPLATTSFSEEFVKPEPEFKSEMFHDSDCEFFQDLVQWCAAPAEQEVAPSIDRSKITEARAHNIDTLHTQFSPQGWERYDANSPSAQAFTYNQPPSYPVSPTVESANFNMEYLDTQNINTNKVPFQEQFLDITNLPVVLGDLASDNTDINPWTHTEPIWQNTFNMDYDKTHTNTLPFIDQEDSLDSKLVSVTPRDVENNNVLISEYIIDSEIDSGGIQGREDTSLDRRAGVLSVDVNTRIQPWPCDVISTPEVLSFVEQLEKEKCSIPNSITPPVQEDVILDDNTTSKIEHSPLVDYEPITPKTEPHIDSEEDTKSNRKRRHHDSEDSDETYTPYTEHTPRKYRRRKPNIPIKDMIRELEGSQQLTKARRGRPPKRRESTVSTISENSSTVSTHEIKYRELRDKNNEASKRSRMNRKLKELQMEQMANELEERNKKLKVRADLLEDMTKKLRDAFMAAVSQKSSQ